MIDTPYQTGFWDDQRWFGDAPCGCSRHTRRWDRYPCFEIVTMCDHHLKQWRERPSSVRYLFSTDPTGRGGIPWPWEIALRIEKFLRWCAS